MHQHMHYYYLHSCLTIQFMVFSPVTWICTARFFCAKHFLFCLTLLETNNFCIIITVCPDVATFFFAVVFSGKMLGKLIRNKNTWFCWRCRFYVYMGNIGKCQFSSKFFLKYCGCLLEAAMASNGLTISMK